MNSKIIRSLISLLITGIFLLFAYSSSESENKSKTESKTESTTVELNADVRFDGAQFIISNEDYFDWKNVRLEINSSGLRSGYIYRADLIKSNTTYTIGALQFAKKDGERFNPFQSKPLNFSIICELSGGKSGIYYGGWE
jgi:hypothetical protein